MTEKSTLIDEYNILFVLPSLVSNRELVFL